MDATFVPTQALLLAHTPNYGAFRSHLKTVQRTLSGSDLARSQIAIRLSHALQDLGERRAGTADVAVLLRQFIRAHNRRLRISTSLWRLLAGRDQETSLHAVFAEDDTVELVANNWSPPWLPGAEQIDTLAMRRSDEPAPGDGILYAMSERGSSQHGWVTYQSSAQREAVHASLFASPGSTTLVMLPTGAGKSQCVLLPAWAESRGGSIKGGTSIVVVPTVSLAIDQHRQALGYFQNARTPEFLPHIWTGSTGPDVRDAIRRGLRAGTLPLLFLSPEALIDSDLYAICLAAARDGTLNRLVIDEAHIVETWGAGFRTEFQFLATYRRRLLAASDGQLKTLLLSATVSERTEALLDELFAEEGQLCTVRANRLRPEPSYWFSISDTPTMREERVLEALRHLPRPAILYVIQPEQAEQWVRRLREEGFERIASYSGHTAADERVQLQREWDEGRRDLMVATSAFGLGVDKQDVRTIIHACLPENISRFYQEVGRAGRDGCSAISLVCTETGDERLAFEMTTTARITSKLALGRWKGMRQTAQSVDGKGDLLRVNVNAVPVYDPEMIHSQRNQDWNEHVLLLMQRAGAIFITETRGQLLPADTTGEPAAAWLQIRIHQPAVANDDDTFLQVIESTRQDEANEVRGAVREMRDLVRQFAEPKSTRCIALTLGRLYPETAYACGGCPVCRHEGRPPYAVPLPLSTYSALTRGTAAYLDGDFQRLLGQQRTLHLRYDDVLDPAMLQRAIIALVGKGVQQIVLPTEWLIDPGWLAMLIRSLAKHSKIPHRLMSADQTGLLGQQILYALPTAVVYPPDPMRADKLYRQLRDGLLSDTPRVHIAAVGLYLTSEHGLLVDRVDGMVTDLVSLDEAESTSTSRDLF